MGLPYNVLRIQAEELAGVSMKTPCRFRRGAGRSKTRPLPVKNQPPGASA